MKHGKRPTKRQCERISRYSLNPDNWLVVKDCHERFELVNRITNKIRVLPVKEGNCDT